MTSRCDKVTKFLQEYTELAKKDEERYGKEMTGVFGRT